MLAIVIGPASVQDRDGVPDLVRRARRQFPWLIHIFADAAYAASKVEHTLRRSGGIALEIITRPDAARGFIVQARRWVIERTFGWVTRCRRLARHYEALATTAVAFVTLAMIRIMLRRLVRGDRPS